MKFKLVLVLAFVFSSTFSSLSQTPDDELPESLAFLKSSSLFHWIDSLANDPLFQQDMISFMEDFSSGVGLNPAAVLDTPLPNFHLRDLNGKVVNNQKLQGKVVFLHIWYPGSEEFPEETAPLNELKERYRDQEVIFLSLTWADADYLRHFLQSRPLDFTHLPEAGSLIDELTIFPQNILVDQEGIIRYIANNPFKGMFEPQPTNWYAVQKQIDALLTK